MRQVHHHRSLGLTLIELLIAVVVVAILAAIAVPSYNDSVRKSRRSDAMAALTAVQQAQERWRGNNTAYSTSFSDLGVSENSAGGYYTLTLSGLGANGNELAAGFIVTATAVTGSSQAADSCATMSLRMQGGNIGYAGGAADASLSYAETHTCFVR